MVDVGGHSKAEHTEFSPHASRPTPLLRSVMAEDLRGPCNILVGDLILLAGGVTLETLRDHQP